MNRRKHTKIDKSHLATKQLRPRTSRKHSLKPVHYFLWQWMWERQRLLPGEQYIESQLAAAKHFGVNQSTISRQLGRLIKHEAVIVLKKRERGTSHFWTSVTVKVTEPPTLLHADLQAEKTPEFSTTSSTCKNASPNTVHSPLCSPNKNTPFTDYKSSTTVDDDTVNDANLHIEKVLENEGHALHAKLHIENLSLADELVAAKKGLADLEQHIAQHGIDGWEETLRRQRAKVRELEREYNGRTQ